MKNLIGDDILKIDNITQGQDHNLYLYNKKHIKPGRKMGHINVVAENYNELSSKLLNLLSFIPSESFPLLTDEAKRIAEL